MDPIRRILCPLDFSDPSNRALDRAVELARVFGAELDLLHVTRSAVYTLREGPLLTPPEIRERGARVLRAALAEYAQKAKGVRVRTHLLEGEAHQEITKLARELPADLVVMGTHGRTGLKHLLIGSVAERVVRTSSVPVLVVPSA